MDQHVNSDLITHQKAGVELYNKEHMNPFDFEANLTYKDPAFDHTKVETCFNQILKDPIYKQNIQKLQAMSKMTQGRKRFAQIVEEVH